MSPTETEPTDASNSESTSQKTVSRRHVLRTGAVTSVTIVFGGTALGGQPAAEGRQTSRKIEGIQPTQRQGKTGPRSNEERAPIILADGSKHYFTYDLETGVIADWTEADQDGTPIWEDDDAVHWIDTTVTDSATDRPDLEITIYQEIVFMADCDGSGIAHPALSPDEWARQDAVSNMDPKNWLVQLAVDEFKAAFDYVVWQLNGRADETPPEKYGVATTGVERFDSLTQSGTCRINLVGVDPQQIIKAGTGPLPTARNGAVTIRVPVSDWALMQRDAGTDLSIRPHQHVANWGERLANPIGVDLVPPRHMDKLVGRDPCDGG